MNTKVKNKILNPHSENTLTKIAYTMNEVCQLLDNLYDVNCGGCWYIAYCLSKLLKEDDLDYCLEVVSIDEEDLEDCCDFSELYRNYSHYGISIGSSYINISEEEIEDAYSYCCFPNVDPTLIWKHYKEQEWNDCYDSNKNDFIWEILEKFYYECTENLRER